jgi:hypothetical protein
MCRTEMRERLKKIYTYEKDIHIRLDKIYTSVFWGGTMGGSGGRRDERTQDGRSTADWRREGRGGGGRQRNKLGWGLYVCVSVIP